MNRNKQFDIFISANNNYNTKIIVLLQNLNKYGEKLSGNFTTQREMHKRQLQKVIQIIISKFHEDNKLEKKKQH